MTTSNVDIDTITEEVLKLPAITSNLDKYWLNDNPDWLKPTKREDLEKIPGWSEANPNWQYKPVPLEVKIINGLRFFIRNMLKNAFEYFPTPLEGTRRSPCAIEIERCNKIEKLASDIKAEASKLQDATRKKIKASKVEGSIDALITDLVDTKIKYYKVQANEKEEITKALMFGWNQIAGQLQMTDKEYKQSQIAFIYAARAYYPEPHCDVTPDAIRNMIKRTNLL